MIRAERNTAMAPVNRQRPEAAQVIALASILHYTRAPGLPGREYVRLDRENAGF